MKAKSSIQLFVLLGILTGIYSFCYQTIPDSIYSALKAGNSKELAKSFNTNIDLVILDKEGVYSKSQAELILKDFFAKNSVNPSNGFIKLHEGGKDASKFIIGTLYTNKGQFRVYLVMKTINGVFTIHQFRIEDDNN
jgi:hypothetical protein